MKTLRCGRCGKVKGGYRRLGESVFCTTCFSKVGGLSVSEGIEKLHCPKCGAAMILGETRMHGTLATFLVAGFSIKDLWFPPYDGSGEEKAVLGNSQTAPGHYCTNCKCVLVDASDP